VREDPSLRQTYDSDKAQPPEQKTALNIKTGTCPVKIIVYVHGGICQDVRTNLSNDSWKYGLVDFDNELDLPDDHIPFSKAEMQPLPSMTEILGLLQAAHRTIENWETGDLAGSVRQMANILKQIDQ
jgi:hypothetical protein